MQPSCWLPAAWASAWVTRASRSSCLSTLRAMHPSSRCANVALHCSFLASRAPNKWVVGKGHVIWQEYVEAILALQAKHPKGTVLPLAIMTSGDTHDRTLAFLKENKYFGAAASQVTLIKQEKVRSVGCRHCHPSSLTR